MDRTVWTSLLEQKGNKPRIANSRLTAAMVKVPNWPETKRAEITEVPARANAPNKYRGPFSPLIFVYINFISFSIVEGILMLFYKTNWYY
jgi:hypothetical protein